MRALSDMLISAHEASLKREYMLTKIRNILDNYQTTEPETQHLMGQLQDVLLDE